ncbi:MAG: Si-specific NAD(P)(+) transhydrogenase [Pseudomonadota bacterium]
MNPVDSYDHVVIGSGPAGQKAAIQLAKHAGSVALIEREREIGGECVYRGTIPSKTLRESALEIACLRPRLAALGVSSREDMEVQSLMGRLADVLRAHEKFISDQLGRNGIAMLHGRARFLDPNTLELSQPRGRKRHIVAGKIIIATGSRPRSPDNFEIDHEHILDSDSVLSMIYLPRSLVVLGGGVIACEYATIFAALGVEVTIVDRYPRPLGFLDPDLITAFEEHLDRINCRFIGNTRVKGVEFDGFSQVVTRLDDGTTLHSDKVFCALGRVANVATLGLDRAGIVLTEQGHVPVNRHLQTTQAHIYAVGDVIGPPSLASASMEQGRRAARHALGLDVESGEAPIPAGIYTLPEMSTIGLTEAEVTSQQGAAVTGCAKFAEIARGHISDSQDGLLKMVADADGRKLLGVQIFGQGATELVHIGQMALIAGQDIDVFIDNVFNFPTLAEAYRVAALQIAGKRGQAALTRPARLATY